jgi:hypothetical protein
MLTKDEKLRLQKKLGKLQIAQEKRRDKWIIEMHLDKEGDANWAKYVSRKLKWIKKFFRREYSITRKMYVGELYNLREGIKSPHINI